MPFQITLPTRHTDAYAGTGFVHAGVLLALTETAYAAFQDHCDVGKPDDVVAVQRSTEALYHAPLPWADGATIEVRTTAATDRGFEQEFRLRSAANDAPVATITHRWVWLNTTSGRSVPIPEEVQRRFLAG